MQKYFRKTKEDHSQKSAYGHNLWSLFSLAVETLGLLKYTCVHSKVTLTYYIFCPFYSKYYKKAATPPPRFHNW